MLKIFKGWTLREGRKFLKDNLPSYLESASDARVAFVDLIEDSRRPGNREFVKGALGVFETWIQNERPAFSTIDHDTQRRAMTVFSRVSSDVSLRACDLFDVGPSSRDWALPLIRCLYQHDRNFVTCTILIAKCSLFDDFDTEDLILILLTTNRMQDLEAFADASVDVQRRLLAIFNYWVYLPDASIKEDVLRRSPSVRQAEPSTLNWQFTVHKTLKKLASRFVNKYANGAAGACPNLFRQKAEDFIRYNNYELSGLAIDEETYSDNISPYVMRDKDPEFPKLALYALDHFKNMSDRSGLYVNDELLARLSIKWDIPKESLLNDFSEVYLLIENGQIESPLLKTEAARLFDGIFFELSLEDAAVIDVNDFPSFIKAGEVLCHANVIGIDCEWPSQKVGATPSRVSIIQLAIDDRAFLIDVLSLSEILTRDKWRWLERVFTDDSIVKVGYGLTADFQYLSDSVPSLKNIFRSDALKRCYDLCVVVDRVLTLEPQILFDFDIDSSDVQIGGGLSGLVQHLLGKPLDKSQQRSDWDVRPLRAAQRRYAALDAFVLLRLYENLRERISSSKLKLRMDFLASGELTLLETQNKVMEAKEKERLRSEKNVKSKSSPMTWNFSKLSDTMDLAKRLPEVSRGIPDGLYDSDDDSYDGFDISGGSSDNDEVAVGMDRFNESRPSSIIAALHKRPSTSPSEKPLSLGRGRGRARGRGLVPHVVDPWDDHNDHSVNPGHRWEELSHEKHSTVEKRTFGRGRSSRLSHLSTP